MSKIYILCIVRAADPFRATHKHIIKHQHTNLALQIDAISTLRCNDELRVRTDDCVYKYDLRNQ